MGIYYHILTIHLLNFGYPLDSTIVIHSSGCAVVLHGSTSADREAAFVSQHDCWRENIIAELQWLTQSAKPGVLASGCCGTHFMQGFLRCIVTFLSQHGFIVFLCFSPVLVQGQRSLLLQWLRSSTTRVSDWWALRGFVCCHDQFWTWVAPHESNEVYVLHISSHCVLMAWLEMECPETLCGRECLRFL